MINHYEIKKINGEEVLFLHFNFDQEFAKLNSKNKKKKLKKEIKDYIKKNKINFKGTKVAIIVSGLLIGTIYLNNPSFKETNYKTPKTYAVEVLQNDELSFNIPEYSENNNLEENIINEENLSSNNILENEKPTNNITKDKETSKEKINSKSATQVQEVTKEIVEEEKIIVTIYRSNGSILNLDLEEYLVGVVGAEMPASFNIEALKSQAIIARTYTLKSIERNTLLTDNSSTQNYKDENELKALWGSSFNTYYSKIKNAVASTEGMYLTYNGELIDAVYHSTSNGKTESSQYVWGNSFPYLVSVDSSYDTTNKSFYAENFLSYANISEKLGIDVNIETEINILSKTISNRVEKIEFGLQEYIGVELRTLLGLRSTDFEIEKNESGLIFKTKGYGHGVGLSQYGANGMANAGFTYIEILKHYYTGVAINQL